MVRTALLSFLAGVATILALDWARSPASMEECFIAEARGLADRAVSVAYQLCEKRFPEPTALTLSDEEFGL